MVPIVAPAPPAKSLFASKTFWLNVLGIAAFAVPHLPVAPTTIGYILGGLNIANRLVTTGPASLLGSGDN